VVLVALAFFLFPIFWVTMGAFKLPEEIFHLPPVWIPSQPTLNHFLVVWPLKGYTSLKNSLIVAVSATALAHLVGAPAAYSLARFRTGGHNFSFWLLSQRMMPPVVMVLPIFILAYQLGLLDTYAALIALYTAFQLPYVIWMLRGYFLDIPAEVEESALVDGANRLGVLWRITLPLAAPGLIATATFAFIFCWSEFLFALILTRSHTVTLPVTIAGYVSGQGPFVGQASALTVVATAPIFVAGLLVQKHFVRGLTLGAIKT